MNPVQRNADFVAVLNRAGMLIFLTPRLDRLIARLLAVTDKRKVIEILAEHETEIFVRSPKPPS